MYFENFSIRQLTIKDLEAFFNLIDSNRYRLEDFFSGTVARTRTFADTGIYVSEIISKAELKTYLPFIVINNTNGSFVGFMDLKNIDWNIPKAELGYFIDKEYEGKGLSKKALAIFINHCFIAMGFNKLFLRTHNSNVAARRLAETSGFIIEGTLRKDYKTTEGELVDLLYYGKISGI